MGVGFENYSIEEHIWHFPDNDESFQVLKFVKETVTASFKILMNGGCSDLEAFEMVTKAILALREEDCQVTLKAHMCWAKKGIRGEDC